MYDRAVVAWSLGDSVGLESLKGAFVEYHLLIDGRMLRRVGEFNFTYEGVADQTALPLLKISHTLSAGRDPLRDLVLVFHREAAPTIEVHPDQGVARFLIRTPLVLLP